MSRLIFSDKLFHKLKNWSFSSQNTASLIPKKQPLCLKSSLFFRNQIWHLLHRLASNSSTCLGIVWLAFLGCSCLEAALLPDYDTRCDSMCCRPAEITSGDHFNQSVPKNVHQIWFGNQAKLDRKKTGLWKDFSERFGYNYALWTEQDDDTFQSFMRPQNFELMMQMRQKGDYWAASDILRYELIKKFGGIYVDCDFSPPSDDSGLIDLQNIINFHGLTLMIEPRSRNIGTNTALFVANGFIVCPNNHPVICSLVDQVYDNAMHWYSKTGNFDAMFVTGPFFVNKVLTGSFGVVPCAYLRKYNMWEW